MTKILKPGLVAALLMTASLGATAQGFEIGQRGYMNSCAQCHGAAGKGDGVMAGFLSTRLPDLSTLQKDNGGVFPFARLFDVISGTKAVGAHGTSEMPAWGDRYSAQAPRQLGHEYSLAVQEAFVRGRVLALIEYVSTLQVQ